MMPDLAPRGLGRIFDDALAVYRGNARPLLALAAVSVFPPALVNAVAAVFSARGLMAVVPALTTGEDPFDALTGLGQSTALADAALPFYLLARVLLASAVYVSGAALAERERPPWRELLRRGASRYWTVLLVTVVVWGGVGLVALAGGLATFFLLGLPGLAAAAWLGLRYGLAPVVAGAEGAGLAESLRRSWRLTRGHARRYLAFGVLQVLLVTAFETAVGSVNALRQVADALRDPESLFREVSLAWKAVEGLVSAGSATLVLPFGMLATYLFYLDLRARSEGLDLLVRARAVSETP